MLYFKFIFAFICRLANIEEHVLKKRKFDVIFYWEVVLMQRWESLHFFVAGRFFGEEKDIKIVL